MKEIEIELEGTSSLKTDRFLGRGKQEFPPEQKLYLTEDGMVHLPVENLMSFFATEKHTPFGAIKVLEGRGCGEWIRKFNASVRVKEETIPFLGDKSKPVKFSGFDNGKFVVDVRSPRDEKGLVMDAISRPVMLLPWKLRFTLMIYFNEEELQQKLSYWLEYGGRLVGLCNHRPLFGQFELTEFKVVEKNEGRKRHNK